MIRRHWLAFALLAFGAAHAQAGEKPLLDYRNQDFLIGRAFYSEADHRKIAAALAEASKSAASEMGEEFAVLGDAEGAFTAPETSERIYLVQKSAPVAIDPFPDGPAPVLIAMAGKKATGLFRLPKDRQYQRLVAAADGNGDGRAEVLLEGSFMNMGQSVTSLDVVTLSQDGTAKPTGKLEEVYVDGCDNPAGKRDRSASTVTVGARGFDAEKHDIGCGN